MKVQTGKRTGFWSALAMATVTVVGACVLRTETVAGPAGEQGDPGPKGDPGTPGPTGVWIDGGMLSTQDLADLVVAQQQTIAALQVQIDTLSQQLSQKQVCGWFSPAHNASCNVECQNFSQFAIDAGWTSCLSRPSTGLNQPYGRQFFNDAQCTHPISDSDYAYWDSRFHVLSGFENTGAGGGALFLQWNGCNDIVPAFWCCKQVTL